MSHVTVPAAEVLPRLLSLIDSLHAPQDLTPERVEQASGLKLVRNRELNSFSRFETLTKQWDYIIHMWSDRVTHLPSLGVRFQETDAYQGRAAPMTGVCQMDMAQFHASLLKIGFQNIGNTRAATPELQFSRGRVLLNMAYVGESDEAIDHNCVLSVSVSFASNEPQGEPK